MTDSINPESLARAVADELAPRAKGYDRAPDVPEFYGFDLRTHVFSLDPNMRPIQRKLDWMEEPIRRPVVPINGDYPKAFSLPIPVSGLRTPYYPTNLGLVVISGGTEAGKSSFLRALATMAPIKRLLAVEPYDTPDEIEELPYYSSFDNALAAAVQARYRGDFNQMYAIDSLRAPLFETGGNAGSKGIVMPFFTQITRVSQELAKAGMTVLATVNPMEEDKAFTEAFLKKLSASTSTCILLTSSERRGGVSTFTGTIASRPDRTPRPFTLVVGDQAAPIDRSALLSEITFTAADNGFNDNFNDSSIVSSLEKVI